MDPLPVNIQACGTSLDFRFPVIAMKKRRATTLKIIGRMSHADSIISNAVARAASTAEGRISRRGPCAFHVRHGSPSAVELSANGSAMSSLPVACSRTVRRQCYAQQQNNKPSDNKKKAVARYASKRHGTTPKSMRRNIQLILNFRK